MEGFLNKKQVKTLLFATKDFLIWLSADYIKSPTLTVDHFGRMSGELSF